MGWWEWVGWGWDALRGRPFWGGRGGRRAPGCEAWAWAWALALGGPCLTIMGHSPGAPPEGPSAVTVTSTNKQLRA